MPNNIYLTSAEVVAQLVAIAPSKKTLNTLVRAAGFPPPLRLNQRRHLWVAAEVDDWLEAKLAERYAA